MATVEEAYQEFRALFSKHLPNLPISSTGYGGNEFHARLHDLNMAYTNTKYSYKGENRFIHWTGLKSLLSIINYREIRLYNLLNSKDDKEFIVAGEELGLSEMMIKHIRQHSYIFSFNKFEELNNEDQWKEYGHNYEGVAIEFSIVGNPANWENFMIAEIQYEVPDEFRRFASDLKKLKDKHGFTTDRMDLNRVIAFHKRNDLHKEKEVRIAGFYPFSGYDMFAKVNTDFRIDKSTSIHKISKYINIPLYIEKSYFNEAPVFENDERLPLIKIENIYIGKDSGIPEDVFYEYREELIHMISFKLNYRVELEYNPFG